MGDCKEITPYTLCQINSRLIRFLKFICDFVKVPNILDVFFKDFYLSSIPSSFS